MTMAKILSVSLWTHCSWSVVADIKLEIDGGETHGGGPGADVEGVGTDGAQAVVHPDGVGVCPLTPGPPVLDIFKDSLGLLSPL